jgi:hypothetical protein
MQQLSAQQIRISANHQRSDQIAVKNRLKRVADDPFDHRHASMFEEHRLANRTPYMSSTSVEANPLKQYLQTRTGTDSSHQ